MKLKRGEAIFFWILVVLTWSCLMGIIYWAFITPGARA